MISKLIGAMLLMMLAASAFSEPRGRFLTPEKREELKQKLLSRPAFQNNESKENRDLSGSEPPQRVGESLTREPDPAARTTGLAPADATNSPTTSTVPTTQVAPTEAQAKPADEGVRTARREPPFRRFNRQPSSLPVRMNWIWLILGVTLGVVSTLFLRRNK